MEGTIKAKCRGWGILAEKHTREACPVVRYRSGKGVVWCGTRRAGWTLECVTIYTQVCGVGSAGQTSWQGGVG